MITILEALVQQTLQLSIGAMARQIMVMYGCVVVQLFPSDNNSDLNQPVSAIKQMQLVWRTAWKVSQLFRVLVQLSNNGSR